MYFCQQKSHHPKISPSSNTSAVKHSCPHPKQVECIGTRGSAIGRLLSTRRFIASSSFCQGLDFLGEPMAAIGDRFLFPPSVRRGTMEPFRYCPISPRFQEPIGTVRNHGTDRLTSPP